MFPCASALITLSPPKCPQMKQDSVQRECLCLAGCVSETAFNVALQPLLNRFGTLSGRVFVGLNTELKVVTGSTVSVSLYSFRWRAPNDNNVSFWGFLLNICIIMHRFTSLIARCADAPVDSGGFHSLNKIWARLFWVSGRIYENFTGRRVVEGSDYAHGTRLTST